MKRMILLPLIFSTTAAWAQSDTASTRGTLSSEAVSTIPTGWVPYLGLNAGYTSSDLIESGENLQEGMPSSIKLLGSYYTDSQNWVFDVGYGYNNQQFSREAAPARSVSGPSIEGAARYQWESRWQAGVIAQTLFDRGEYYGANQADAQFAGLQALKEFAIAPAWTARLGGRLLTDLNVNSETVNMALIDLQIGWDPSANQQSVRDVASTPDNAAAPSSALGSVKLETDRPGFVRFELDSAQVANADRNRIRDLARVLQERSDLFQSVEIVGHADPTGTEPYNQELSERRAASVRDILVDAGWTQGNLQTSGRGESELAIMSELAPNFGDNRRVEIQFNGVRDQRALRDVLSRFE